ncbi:flagellar hook-associated protein FlgK [Aquabacter sp. CN5-332]|uniref:flagellar hook-associated protein FlgK n=1 Tax=Aquabacter sp. CN5-332 TaxID=3156608 RepID=UPI0032B5E31F
MSLSLAFNSARSSLMATSSQIEVSSRNTGGADMPGYSRKIANTTTSALGSAYVVQVSRASDQALYNRMISATSRTAGQQALLSGLNQLQSAVGTPDSANSPAARISALADALAQFRNAPDEPGMGTNAVLAARDLAASLNSAAAGVLDVRSDADAAIADSVSRVNDLLQQFAVENSAVVGGTLSGADVTDALDRRDSILSQLSEEMGISTVTRPGNDIVIYAAGGATLFEKTPRAVTFQPTAVYGPGTTGGSVFVDGVAVTGPSAPMPLTSGRITGLTQLRDDVAVTFQTQLDEMANALVASFSEHTTLAPPPAPPSAAGLFQAGGSPGSARSITVNPLVDPAQGGSADRIRDGITYDYNADDATSFPDHLQQLVDDLSAQRTFSPTGQIVTQTNLADYGSASVAWLAAQRQAASTSADTEAALLSHASTALSNATGVNMDEEYIHQLDLEHSYQASSKLIGVINELYDTLLNIR